MNKQDHNSPPASTPIKGPLTAAESIRLAELEPVILAGLQNFVQVGTALLEISDRRLYRDTHSSFKDYCREKWNMTASRAYQLCEASEVLKSLPAEVSTIVDTESKARELAKIPAAKRVSVLKSVSVKSKRTGRKPTAKAIREARLRGAQLKESPVASTVPPPHPLCEMLDESCNLLKLAGAENLEGLDPVQLAAAWRKYQEIERIARAKALEAEREIGLRIKSGEVRP